MRRKETMTLNFSTETKEQQQLEKKKRTRKQAENEGAITKMPKQLAIPTLAPYQDAMSTVKNPAAHLQPIKPEIVDNLKFDVKDGKGELYFHGKKASRTNLKEYYDNDRRQELDLPMLRALYSVILQKIEDEIKNLDVDKLMAWEQDPEYLIQSVKLYMPSILQMLGYKQNSNDGGATIKKIKRFNSILGVMQEKKNGRTYESYYPVMVLKEDHDARNNTIEFASPYINKLVMTILCASIQMDKHGNPRLKRNGKPFTRPSHSHLIKASIAKEKNQRAVEIVCIVVTLIEQAGGEGTPHIRAQTIIDRCPDLKNALETARSGNKSLILKRAFSRAWELLPEQTKLTESYRNIKFPTTIPTASTLDMVFEFPHKGKVKQDRKKT